MSHPLVASSFLFRFAVPCFRLDAAGTGAGRELGEAYRIPSFQELDGKVRFADLRLGWAPEGLAFWLEVTGKRRQAWCRTTRLADSDGLHLWIDTRDTHTVHRATRFCHRFAFLPFGGTPSGQEPVAQWCPIDRAREHPKPISRNALQVQSQSLSDGYRLTGFLPATALTGYDPDDQPRLGFFYTVVDAEQGLQAFSLGPEFPIADDPSVWGTLELAPRIPARPGSARPQPNGDL